MSQTVNFGNFNLNNRVAQTQLTADTTSGVSSLSVTNSTDFFNGGPVVIGNLGAQGAELLTANSGSTATSIPLSSPTQISHNFNDFVTLLFGSQIRIYRANDTYGNGTQPLDAGFSLINTITIDPRSTLSSYTDAAGAYPMWYKYTYYNPSTGGETLLSDSNAVQAGITHYVSIDQVRRAASLTTNSKVSNDVIAEFRDAAEREVNGALQALYQFPLPQPTNPIIVQIVKNIAAGELMQEVYSPVSTQMVEMGMQKASHGRMGDGDRVTGLAQLINRSIVLQDANFNELADDEAHGFGGWPDETTMDTTGTLSNAELGLAGKDHGFDFFVGKEY